jgi:hypothetical protein
MEGDLPEDMQKKLDRFLRKVAPLIEKELNENLPLYSSKIVDKLQISVSGRKKDISKSKQG